jgi:hypothetical protein
VPGKCPSEETLEEESERQEISIEELQMRRNIRREEMDDFEEGLKGEGLEL